MTDLINMLERHALKKWYGVKDTTSRRPIVNHLAWHSPFVLTTPDESSEQRMGRVRQAGEIWLVNVDLRPYRQLWVTDEESGYSFGFCRAQTPGDDHLVVGPLDGKVVVDGIQLLDSSIYYMEVNQSPYDDELRQIAAQRRNEQ